MFKPAFLQFPSSNLRYINYGMEINILPTFYLDVFAAVARERGEGALVGLHKKKLGQFFKTRRASARERRHAELVKLVNDEDAPSVDRECSRWLLIDEGLKFHLANAPLDLASAASKAHWRLTFIAPINEALMKAFPEESKREQAIARCLAPLRRERPSSE